MSNTISIDERLDLIVKKRQCSQSQSDIVGGRRKTHERKNRVENLAKKKKKLAQIIIFR